VQHPHDAGMLGDDLRQVPSSPATSNATSRDSA
jgi:hypothetical protein